MFLVLYDSNYIELKGNAFVSNNLSVLGTTLFSENVEIVNNGKIITPEVSTKIINVDSSGTVLKNTSGVDMSKIFNSGTLLASNSVIIRENLTVDGDITFNGNVSSMYWAAAHIDTNGNILSQKGSNAITCNKRSGDIAYDISFASHPDLNNYVVLLSSTEFHTCYRFQNSTSFVVYLRNAATSGSAPNGDGTFDILKLK